MPRTKRTLGWVVVDWIETYLCHGPGDVEGEPLFLTDEQVRFVLKAYELDANGKRIIRRAFLSRVKGWAKSETAGMLVCAEALGPVRFDGWDSKKEPVGRPVRSPFIRCLATEEDQSGNTYDNVTVMLRHALEHHGDEFKGLDVGLTRTFLPGGGEIVPSTSSNASKDGGKETFAVFDETHLYDRPELRKMHDTVRRNLAKRKAAEPWSLETSTMYKPAMNSVAEATHEYAKAVADGRIKDSGLLFDHLQGPSDFDFDDDDQLKDALRQAFGDAASFMDFDRLLAEIRDPQSEEADSRRYWLNQVVKSTEQAFDPLRWAELVEVKDVPEGELITLGFDGARFHDATAIIGTHVETGHQFVVGLWERPLDVEEWEVDEQDVEQCLENAFETWDVWRLYADPPYWETQVARWAGRWGEKRVVSWYTNRNKQMAYAVRAYASAQKAGELTHDGNEDFARHIGNARKRDTRMRDEHGIPLWLIQKEHPKSPLKMDAAMAGCLSWEARSDALTAGALRKRKRSRVPVGF